MKLLISSMAFCTALGVQAAVYPHTDPANLGNWILQTAVSDEFEGTRLDETKWQVCGRDGVYWGQGGSNPGFTGRGYDPAGYDTGWEYNPDNLRVTNGLLIITTKYDPTYPWVNNPNGWNFEFTTGGMWSKAQSAATGYMEIRCRLPDAATVGSFWTTGDACELDVFEATGSPNSNLSRTNKMWSSLHDWTKPIPNHAWTDTSVLPFNFRDGFHTYAAEWDADSLKIYADGQLIHETTRAWVETNGIYSTRWPLTGGQHIWADAEIFPWWGIPTPASLPADYEVEYIRVWEKGPPLAPSPWQGFVQQYGLSGAKTNNTDGDALSDWGEYIYGGDPTNPALIGILPEFNPATGDYLYSLRNDTQLVARVLSKTNLLDTAWTTNSTLTVTNNNGAMAAHAAFVGTLDRQLFLRLEAGENLPIYGTPVYQLILGTAAGNGDFESGAPAAGSHPYQDTPNWFNASGAETVSFIIDTQMNGSSQSGSHGGMPFQNRVQVNNTGYTVVASGEIFSLSYDFGAGGSPAGWDGDETMRTFLFTASVPVDGNLTPADITELGGDDYAVNRAADGQWTTRTVPVLYTTTAADVGKTLYFGMEFKNPGGTTLYPRIDVIQLEVNK